MTSGIGRMTPAVLAAALSVSGGLAWGAQPTTEELVQQIQQLQAKVAALEANQTHSKDVDATVEALLRDADRRSQLMSVEGFTAGYDSKKGFVIQSADGNFLLHPYLQLQTRYAANYREDAKNDDSGDTESGFEIRRAKFGFDGNMFTPDLTYQFQWATNRKDTTKSSTDSAGESFTDTTSAGGTPILEDAWTRYKFADFWAVRGGQYKDPFAHEQLVSAMKQLAVERSLLNTVLEGGDNYIQGVSLIYDDSDLSIGPTRAEFAFTDGFGSANTNFQPSTYNFGLAGRAEWMAIGKSWSQYSQFSAMGQKDDMLVLGLGGDWSQGNNINSYWYTTDAQWEPQAVKGLALYGAYVGRSVETNHGDVSGGTSDSSYDWGFLAQAGYMVTQRWEPFVRYDYIGLDTDGVNAGPAAITDAVQEITAGVNYYVHGQAAKFTLDLTYLPSGNPFSGTDGTDILTQSNDSAQVVARVQFQLVL